MAFQDRFSWLWPTIVDKASAKRASMCGLVACAWCAGATILVVMVNMLGVDLLHFHISALLDALLFIIIGWGIHRMSRFAAMAGLALEVYERAAQVFERAFSHGFVLDIFLVLLLISSVRATFAYHKYRKEEDEKARRKETGLFPQRGAVPEEPNGNAGGERT